MSLFVYPVHKTRELLQQVALMDQSEMDYPWHTDDWLSIESDDHFLLGVITVEECQAGFILFFDNKLDETLHLLKIAVKKEFRGTGLALEMLRSSIVASIDKESIFLEVAENNLVAIEFYLKLGFQKLLLKKQYYTDGQNAWAMNLLRTSLAKT
jgi:ribosomal-protein-alanine N-acetyltransferase